MEFSTGFTVPVKEILNPLHGVESRDGRPVSGAHVIAIHESITWS